jgi:hypothetical protein
MSRVSKSADVVGSCVKFVSLRTPTWIGDAVQEHTRPACILLGG